MRRSRDWNESLSNDLRNREFAREFVVALLDEGFSLREALAKTIRAYGLTEFASKAGMAAPNLSRSISPSANPTERTLEQLLRPFGLRLAVSTKAAPRRPRRKVA